MKPSITESDGDRLGWRINEFCRLVGISRPTLWRMAKTGKVHLEYLGDIPIITRAEAVRLGLLSR
jgi:hypothetical protein